MKRRLIVFTRFPQVGRVKTRLIPALGADGAAQLHREMTVHTLGCASELGRQHGIEIEVWFADANIEAMQRTFGKDLRYLHQGEGDLGQRIVNAIGDRIENTVVIGTDCPELSARHVLAAFAFLQSHDVVLGPATDGGYYLIGLNRPLPELFRGIAWGTDSVCVETRQIAADRKLSVASLDSLSDIDRPEDLSIWNRVQENTHCSTEQITIVIPTLNEAEELPATLSQFKGLTNTEVIVVDGGSTDETRRIATMHGARVIDSGRGRGHQMNAGAAAANGTVLLFLHADTQLPNKFASHVHSTLTQPGVAAGAFLLEVAAPSRSLRWIEWGANIRSRWCQLPYGDQAIFVSAEKFRQLGGFAELPLMEDVEFIRRCRRHGRIAIASAAVRTSGRRWLRLGVAKTTCLNCILLVAYFLGVSPRIVARWYRRLH